MLDFALSSIGCFAVPIFGSSSAEQIEWVLEDSHAVAVIVSSTDMAQRVREATLNSPAVWVMDDGLQEQVSAEGVDVPDDVPAKRPAAASGLERPTCLVGVPRIVERIFNATQQKAMPRARVGSSNVPRKSPSRPRHPHRQAALATPPRTRALRPLGVRQEPRGDGGRPVLCDHRRGQPRRASRHFFAGIGPTVMEGYGLRETTTSGPFNRAERSRIGSVGQPMPGTAVRIADEGEIWLRGRHVMARYHKNQAMRPMTPSTRTGGQGSTTRSEVRRGYRGVGCFQVMFPATRIGSTRLVNPGPSPSPPKPSKPQHQAAAAASKAHVCAWPAATVV